jgi:tetratricopeptide (TPR) repeat protein
VALLSAALLLAVTLGFALVTWKWQEELAARELAEHKEKEADTARLLELQAREHESQARQQAQAREQQAEQARTKEQLARQEADQQKREAEAKSAIALIYWGDARDAVEKMLTEISEGEQFLKNEPRFEQVRRKLLEQALAYYQKFLQQKSDDPIVRLATAEAYGRVAGIHRELGSPEIAENSYRESIRLLEQLHKDFPDDVKYAAHLGIACSGLGAFLESTGRFPEAEQLFRQALPLLEQAVAKEHLAAYLAGLASVCNNLGIVLENMRNLTEAEQMYLRAVELSQVLVDELPEVAAYRHGLASSCHNLALLLRLTGQVQEAEKLFRRALVHRQKLIAAYPTVAAYRQGLARTSGGLAALLERSNPAVAEKLHRQALDLNEKLVKDFPTVAEYRADLAESCRSLGIMSERASKLEDAEKLFRQGIALGQKLVADYPTVSAYRYTLAGNCNSLGIVLERLQRPTEAVAVYRQGLELHQKLAADHPGIAHYRESVGNTSLNVGMCLVTQNRLAEAEEHFRRGAHAYQELSELFPGRQDYAPKIAQALALLGDLHFQQKQWNQARAVLGHALARYQVLWRKNPSDPQIRFAVNYVAPRLVASCLQLELHAEAAAVTANMGKWADKDIAQLTRAAAVLGYCVSLARKDANLGAAERTHRTLVYGDQSIALLQRAIDNGFRDAAALKMHPAFADVRGRDDFQALIQVLQK